MLRFGKLMHFILKQLLLGVAFLLVSIEGFSQLSRTHYIPPITAAPNGNALPQNQYLHISTPSQTPVNVAVNQLGAGVVNYSVTNASPLEISIGSGDNTSFIVGATDTGGIVSNKGYIIQSEKPVYVSVRLTAGSQNQAGSLVSKGLSGIGSTFRVGTFTNLKDFSSANQDYINFVSVMATENNTQVDFSDLPLDAIVANNTPLTVSLDAGESYIVALNPAETPSNRDGLIGALVSANKPIAVNCGSFNGSNSNGGGRDAGIDQIAPLETIAIEGQEHSEYIFVRANGYDDIERPLIIAHYDNTEVWVDGNSTSGTGVLQAVLNAGEYISLGGEFFSTQSSTGSNPGGNLYVWTSKTTFAYQGIGGTNSEANQEMFFVPPLNCETPKTIDNIPLIQSSGSGGATFNGGVTIVAEAGSMVNVNGAPTTASPQPVFGNSNYVTYLVNGLSGNVSITSDGQIYVSYYGANGAAALGGFYSGFIFKPEIISNAIDVSVNELCIPFIELSLSTEESFDAYQWFYNGSPIAGATQETFMPNTPGFYQLEGIILDCSTVLSDNIPVSGCVGDYDQDGINNNLDADLDNDGILNTTESNCNFDFDLSANSGPYFSATQNVSSANAEPVPFQGFADQTMILRASSAPGTEESSTTYQLDFDAPTQFRIEQAPATTSNGDMDDLEQYIISVPFDQTVTVYNPDNQLLIDVNYDGVYDNNIQEFSAFEIRFKLNSALLPTGNGTFFFQSQEATQFNIQYLNISELNVNEVAFQLTQTCRGIDSDGDSIADNFDLDSDNDGISDLNESGNIALDLNQDGQVDDLNLNDIDNNGHHDLAIAPQDSDTDSLPNYLDLDSDNDGLYDAFEAGIGINTLDLDNNGQIDPGFVDANLNGFADLAEAITPIDSDLDGLPDYIELDSDDDGCFDVVEAGFQGTLGVLDGVGIDSNGLVTGGNGYDNALDTNADGLFDYQEFIEIIAIPIPSPIHVCETGQTIIELDLEPTSNNFDSVVWQWSFDNGSNWADVPETPLNFEDTTTDILQVLNAPLSLSNTQFRAKMTRFDYACDSFYSTAVEVIVDPLPTVVSNVSLFQCDQDTDGITPFNLNEANELISSNYENETFTFYLNSSDAQLGNSNTISDPVAYQNATTDPSINPNEIFVRVETQQGCALVSQLNLFVSTTQIPSDFSIPPYQECYDDTDGQTTFDFSNSEALILNLFPPTQPLTVTYYETESDALSEINAISDTANYQNTSGSNQTIWVRIDSDIDNSCVGLGPYIDLIVNPLPVLNTPIDPYFCVTGPNTLVVDLNTEYDNFILNSQSATNFSVTYYTSLALAENSTSAITSIGNSSPTQTIFYRISNTVTNCFDIDQFEINFIETPVANPISSFEICDTDNDGLFLFDTSVLETQVLGTQAGMSIAYLDSFGNPLTDANNNFIVSPFPSTFLTSSQVITAVVFNGFCNDAHVDIEFLVNPNTQFLVDDVVICDGSSELIQLNLENPSEEFNFQWVLPDNSVINTSDPELLVSQIGAYEVSAINLNGSCSFSQNFQVFESEGPSITLDDITIVEGTSNNSILIDESALGSANYEFKLIDENGFLVSGFQDDGFFGQLTGGFYNLYVRDELQCEEVVITVPVLYIPNFFTPNDDGYNDVWQIKGVFSSDYIYSNILIFDRYGKLLKNMTLNQNFWDGTYNGLKMPSSDYWYSIELQRSDGSIFNRQGHFSLRR